MAFMFSDLLFAVTTGVYADRLWDALLIDLPSMDPATTWLRAIWFVAGFSVLAMPYVVFRGFIVPRFFEWMRNFKSRRRPMPYVY